MYKTISLLYLTSESLFSYSWEQCNKLWKSDCKKIFSRSLTGYWQQPFNATFTQEERFYVNKYNIVQVPMMLHSGKFYLAYDPMLKVGILKLPCKDGIAMLVLLPDEDVDYTYVDESMTGEVFRGWVAKLKKTWVM